MSDEQIHWNHTLTLRGGAVLFQPPWVWNTLILGQIFDSSLGLAQVKVCRYINIYDSNISMPCFSWMVFVQKIYNFVFSLYIFLSEGLAKIFNFFPHFTEADKPPKRLGYLFLSKIVQMDIVSCKTRYVHQFLVLLYIFVISWTIKLHGKQFISICMISHVMGI